MKVSAAVIILRATAASASLYDTILPTTKGTITRDPWYCATKILESYFDVPMPTGKVEDAIYAQGSKLHEGCQTTMTDSVGMYVCAFPPMESWCAITDNAAATILDEYSSYGSVASSWWAKHSSAAVSEARNCPNKWFTAMNALPAGPSWLNTTIALAGCHELAKNEAHTTLKSVTTEAPAATAGSGATNSPPTATSTSAQSNGVVGRGDNGEMWVIAGTGLVAAAANTLL